MRLLEWFGSLSDAWSADERTLKTAGLDGQALQSLLHHRPKIDLSMEMARVDHAGARLVTPENEQYPVHLADIDDAPVVLYVKGRLSTSDKLALSVVGTRKATRYGQDAAYELSRHLAQQRVTIVSGLALGVDTSAHTGALEGGGRTIAVLGCGVDVVYPRENEELARRICGQGAVISEFPLGTQPVAANFPRRNRILSGIALGVLVVEAPEHSGALITAHLAAEQGREVFAVPSNMFNKMGRGTNRLIQDGAKLVLDAKDILEELNVAYRETDTRVRTQQVAPSNDIETNLLSKLSTDPIHIDDLVRLTGLPIAEVSSTLVILELKGLAQMVGHMQYSKVFRP